MREQACFDHDLQVPATFYVVTDDGVQAIHIFLDERLEDLLTHQDQTIWRALIELVEEIVER